MSEKRNLSGRYSKFSEFMKLYFARAREEESKERVKGIRNIRLKKEYMSEDKAVKEDATKLAVMSWLNSQGWRACLGSDPPDLFATNGKKCIGVEVVAYRLRAHSFYIGEAALSFNEGEIFFIIVVEVSLKQYMPLILTRAEMAAKCEGKYKPRRDNISLSLPRSLKDWAEHREKWDKLWNNFRNF